MSIVLCGLPKTGLGNQLFPLLKASLFARLNNLPVRITGYNQFKPGPYLRGDKSKRNYCGYFKFEKSIAGEMIDRLMLIYFSRYQVISEPAIAVLQNIQSRQLFVFNKLPHWSDYFEGLKDHRNAVIQLFLDLLSPAISNRYTSAQPPVIGVHVRLGDFRKLNEGEDFSKSGVVRTPIEYFINVINGIRTIHGSDLPVSVFTDGYKEELGQLPELSNLEVIEGNRDIVDLLLLSKSRVIVTSTGSTFSYWAGFLSDAVLIMHPEHIHQPIRPIEMQQVVYEGAFDPGNHLLVNNIKAIA